GKCEETSTLLPLPPEPKSAGATEEKSLPQPSICSRPPTRVCPVNVRPASANAAPGSVNTRPALANLRLADTTSAAAVHSSPSSTVKIESGTTKVTKGGPHSEEPQKPQGSQGANDIGASEASVKAASGEAGSSGNAPTCTGRGRVAQLMKTFSAESATTPSQTPPRGVKPPLPTKPSHLRLTTTPTVRKLEAYCEASANSLMGWRTLKVALRDGNAHNVDITTKA
ncbi:mucin-5B-like isoform X1, partial [Lates japonicus]